MNSLIRDSGNNYTLYIDQGTTFKFSILFDDLFLLAYSGNYIIGDTALESNNINQSILVSTNPNSGPVDINDLEFFSTIRQHQTSKKSYDFNVNVDIQNLKIDFTLPADVSSGLKYSRYQFDVYVRNTVNGDITKTVGGSVIVTQNITYT